MLENILENYFLDNTLKNWLISFAIIIGGILFAKLIYFLISKVLKLLTLKTKTNIDDVVIEKIERPAIFLIIVLAIKFGLERLHFSENFDLNLHRVFVLLIAFNITWFFIRIIEAIIEEILVPLSKRDDNDLDDQIVLLIERGLRIFLWSLGIVVGLNNAGFDVGGLIAGLGIGGLALALAAQDTVKNIFGGITIFLDKPFRLNDRIVINGLDGIIESIGIRSTRLRTFQGTLISIPNAQFSDNHIENITIEPSRRVVSILGLTYDTPPEKIELSLQILKQISADNVDLVQHENTLVFFEKFSAFSLDIKFIYFIKKNSDIFNTMHKINYEVLKRFNENHLEFAFPTQTIYRKSLDAPENK